MAPKPSKRLHLDLSDKIKVLNYHDRGTSTRNLASQFNCSKNQIKNVVKNKESLLKECEDFKNRGIKRNEKFCDINEAVIQWFRCARTKNVPLTGISVKENAIQIAESLCVEDFRASNGWLNKFCNRNNIVFKTLRCESANVDKDLCQDWKSRLPIILAGYEDRDVYNLDETGLFFRALPTKS
ncbi:tigger transposable element-derived protein 4-like [Parasteatoda tepidariorum]|uniref:tigger transposable element-derived protein 4-like n=1 Tax=Parasteatoda tepidariorum TaxID=114398 RepID=UPI001C721B02|nr:tigger transposable element-derived protein 4-like [Parasteatoda tepidariorum]